MIEGDPRCEPGRLRAALNPWIYGVRVDRFDERGKPHWECRPPSRQGCARAWWGVWHGASAWQRFRAPTSALLTGEFQTALAQFPQHLQHVCDRVRHPCPDNRVSNPTSMLRLARSGVSAAPRAYAGGIRGTFLIAVAGGALSITAVACGGGSVAATPSPLDSASLVRQANSICKALNHTQQGLTGQAAIKAGLRTFDTDLARLRNLHANATDAAAYARFLAATAKERPLIVAEDTAPPTKSNRPEGAAYTQIAAAGQIAAKLHLAQCALYVDTSLRPASATGYQQQIEGECASFIAASKLVPHPVDPVDFTAYVRALDPLFGQLHRDVRAQPLPAAGAPSIQSWINAFARVQSNLNGMAAAVASHDQAAFNAAKAKLAADTHTAHVNAHSDGIPQCG